MIKKLVLAIVLTLSIGLVGCSSNSTTNSEPKNNDTVVENSKTDNKSEVKKDNPAGSSKDEKKETKKETETLSIYTEDANNMQIKEISTIELNKDLSLEDKLKKYLLLDCIYRNCVKAIYTDYSIQNIKIARGQTIV